ncbi:MAG: DPP IV N-terminal domain-containing protein, partial [Bacteroidota bacterium]
MKNPKAILLFLFIQLLSVNLLHAQQPKLALEDIWGSRKFVAFGLMDVRSMKDGLHYSELIADEKGQYIVKISYASGKTIDTLFKSNTTDLKEEVEGYEFSEDENLIVLSTESEAIYRHSTKANNHIFNRKTGSLVPVSKKGKQQYATLDASGKNVAFVRDNNLYLKSLTNGIEKPITTDGSRNSIINGATDWVYEEEFSFDQGYQWSPNGRYLAYYRFDESEVRQFNLTYY